MKKIWSRLTGGLSKTRDKLANGIDDLVRRHPKLDEELYEELEEILLMSDVGPELTDEIVLGLRERAKKERSTDAGELRPMLAEQIRELLARVDDHTPPVPPPDPESLHVVSLVGVNGVGKTTTLGKLAGRFQAEGHRALIVASDTFRAAAGEQLEIWAKRADVDIVRSKPGSDPGAVAFDGVQAARTRGATVVFIDTAGRLQTNTNLMAELAKIHRVLGKACPGAPHQTLLVLDAVVGQNGLSQAKTFREAVGVTGLVLAKMDGSARGGSILPIVRALGTPVLWVGLGEGMEDIEPFDAEAFVDALLKPTGSES